MSFTIPCRGRVFLCHTAAIRKPISTQYSVKFSSVRTIIITVPPATENSAAISPYNCAEMMARLWDRRVVAERLIKVERNE
jgi:hypothetical protein